MKHCLECTPLQAVTARLHLLVKEKKAAFDLLMSGHIDAMRLLGHELFVTDKLANMCEKFACRMYSKIAVTDVNELRYRLFCSRSTQSTTLPPIKDALKLHILRANYQAAIWHRALSASFDPPSPNGHGWSISGENELRVEWMTMPPAAALIELRKCSGSSGCNLRRCSCRAANMHCTDACTGQNCSNSAADLDDNISSEAEMDEIGSSNSFREK